MKKWLLLATNITASLILAGFFLSISYRTAFPLGTHDRQISLIELSMVLPFSISAFWLLTRLLKHNRSETRFYRLIVWLGNGAPGRRLTASAIGAVLLVCLLNLVAFIMRTML